MWKWLHRGVVGVLLVVTAGVLIVSCLPTENLAEPFVNHTWSDGDFFILRRRDKCLTWTYSRELPPPATVSSSWERRFAGAEIRHLEVKPATGKGILRVSYGILPLWMIAIATSFYPAVFFWRNFRIHRHRRATPLACRHCRYSLKGNESGICPECGEQVERSATLESKT